MSGGRGSFGSFGSFGAFGAFEPFCLRVSYGSLRELETQTLLAKRLRFLNEAETQLLFDQCDEVGRILNGLMKTVSSRIQAKRRRP